MKPKKRNCIIIPAIKKNAVIPDQLIKKLAGTTLIERAINTARGAASGDDIVVFTDSQEITLICERHGVRYRYNRDFRFTSLNIVREMREILLELANDYDYMTIYRASCPLLTWLDIDDALKNLIKSGADSLITVKSVHHRVWKQTGGRLDMLLQDEDEDPPVHVESKALIIIKSDAFGHKRVKLKIIPYFLNDRAIEINSYQDWWICEKLLTRLHVVFVVAGYPAIGMGHVFRALMLANEITDHRISFVCTRESELAVSNIAARDYKTHIQQSNDLAAEVIALRPNLVINDILNTDADYIRKLKESGIKTVNFEDEGPGAFEADLVINALYESKEDLPHFCYGHRFFCLRDEFLEAGRNIFRPEAKCILITFGGTDQRDCTRRILSIVAPICTERGIKIRIVVGPGYAHLDNFKAHLRELDNPLIQFSPATNIMSRMMEGADLAICSAGRTTYELAHMRVPAMVLAHHEREAMHTFARSKNGFAYLGIMDKVSDRKIERVFLRLLEDARRKRLFDRQSRIALGSNKDNVLALILGQLE